MQPTRPAIRVAIVEDHLLQRSMTEDLLSEDGEFVVVFSGEDTPTFLDWLSSASPDMRPQLLILDLIVDRRPSVDVAVVEMLLRQGLPIVVLSALASPSLVRAIVRAGVKGIVGKRDREEDILAAVRAVVRGEFWMTTELAAVIAGDPDRPKLSVQEERSLVLYASGLSLEQVGDAMNIGRETAKQYLDRVRAKYAAIGIPASSKLDLGRIAWADGYVDSSLTSPGAP